MNRTAIDPELEGILDAAKAHGEEGEPDHEVGDLQDVLRAAWTMMSPDQRKMLLASDEVEAVLEWVAEPGSAPSV